MYMIFWIAGVACLGFPMRSLEGFDATLLALGIVLLTLAVGAAESKK